MADQAPEMKATLGLTGLTMNAMALIAPGAFLWLTFAIQGATGNTAPAMWIGIVVALLLCLATAVCYAELAKLYPGTGSSYYFAEQSFLNHEKAWKYARLSKFIVGWGSHLYYWIYPGVMVGVTGIICRLSGRHALAELHERDQSRPDVHDAGRGRVLLRRGVDRPPRRSRIDERQHRDQRDPDHGAVDLCRDGVQLPRRAIRRELRAGSSIRCRAMLTPTNSRRKRSRPTAPPPTASSAITPVCPSRSWMRPASRYRSWSPIRRRTKRAYS